MLAILFSSLLFSGQLRAQFAPAIIPPTLYPTPTSSSIMLDNARTAYVCNYSTNKGFATGKGVDVIGWSYDAGPGGEGAFTVGEHNLFPISSAFVGTTATVNIDHAVDVQVGYMYPYVVISYYNKHDFRYYFSYYTWLGGALTWMATIPLPDFGPTFSYGRIRMDINLDGNKLAIIYEGNGYIYGVGLELYGGGVWSPMPSLAYALSSYGGPSSLNVEPDIAFNRDFSASPVEDYIFYTYHNTGYGQSAVWKYTFSNLISRTGAGTTFIEANALPTGITKVEFDCPDQFSFDHWAYTYSDGNNIYLRVDAGATTYVVNDGSIDPSQTDISSYNNVAPRLAYRNITPDDEIIVGWATDAIFYLASPTHDPSYISSWVRVAGGGGPFIQTDYSILDDSVSAHSSLNPLLALDQNSDQLNRFVSYGTDHPLLGFELKHKNLAFSNPYYKQGTGIAAVGSEDYIKLYPNPFSNTIKLELPNTMQNEVWTIRVSDLLGRTVANYSGKSASDFVAQASATWQAGQYIVKIENANTEPQVIKITKQ